MPVHMLYGIDSKTGRSCRLSYVQRDKATRGIETYLKYPSAPIEKIVAYIRVPVIDLRIWNIRGVQAAGMRIDL